MFVQVKVLKGFPKPLWYAVPAALAPRCKSGVLVRVPLRKKIITAVIERVAKNRPPFSFEFREIIDFESMPADILYLQFIKRLAHYYHIHYIVLLKRLHIFLKKTEIKQDSLYQPTKQILPHVQLTQEQQTVVEQILPNIINATYYPILLHGVTGSGKTEIYKQLIIEAIKNKKSILLLLPEVTLAVQFELLLKNQLPPEIPIYSFHSATSIVQKRLLWQSLLEQKPLLIIGVHLPILLPIANLGGIIVDEEHEIGYQEKKHPKINSKEAAILRAHQNNIPIILGSGTPSITSLHHVCNKKWNYAQLTKRFAGTFPQIEIVSLTDKKERRNFWVSTKLEQAIKQQLEKKEQTIIFLNRRGYSFFVHCKQCAFVIMCDYCSVSLTLHEQNTLVCHYCGVQMALPTQCSACKSADDPYLKKGIGTQQVVSILQKTFSSARIARADLDTTINKKKWQETIQNMQKGNIDILVGTQTITKGYHFPNVTLVGILWADLNLHFPFYNASETTLQQLIQVAGRAGRARESSKVIIQTMIDHPIYNYVTENKYQQFYEYELAKRKMLNYPPYMRFAEIELKSNNEKIIDSEAHNLTFELSRYADKYKVIVLGPAKPPVAKIKNMHIRKIYLKASSMHAISKLYLSTALHDFTSQIFFTPNPLN